MRTMVIGDVHGCHRELQQMLARLSPGPSDRVVFVGDVISKGPDPVASLRLARNTVAAAAAGSEILVGNHERNLLTWLKQRDQGVPAGKRSGSGEGNRMTGEQLTRGEVEWLRGRPDRLALPEHNAIVAHAGLRAGVPLAQQQHADLTAMRSLDAAGLPSPTAGAVSWAASWRGPTHVIFGHDSRRRLQLHPFATGVDTGCVYGGQLTALVLPEGPRSRGDWRLVAVNATATWCYAGSSGGTAAISRSPNCRRSQRPAGSNKEERHQKREEGKREKHRRRDEAKKARRERRRQGGDGTVDK